MLSSLVLPLLPLTLRSPRWPIPVTSSCSNRCCRLATATKLQPQTQTACWCGCRCCGCSCLGPCGLTTAARCRTQQPLEGWCLLLLWWWLQSRWHGLYGDVPSSTTVTTRRSSRCCCRSTAGNLQPDPPACRCGYRCCCRCRGPCDLTNTAWCTGPLLLKILCLFLLLLLLVCLCWLKQGLRGDTRVAASGLQTPRSGQLLVRVPAPFAPLAIALTACLGFATAQLLCTKVPRKACCNYKQL